MAVSRFFQNPRKIIFAENILVWLKRVLRAPPYTDVGGYMRGEKKKFPFSAFSAFSAFYKRLQATTGGLLA